MKICILCLFLLVSSGYTKEPIKYTFTGNLDYTQQKGKTATSSFGTEFRVPLWEHPQKKLMLYCGGSVEHNYNIFNQSQFVSGFGQLGIEF